MEETDVETAVEFIRLLPCDVRVGQGTGCIGDTRDQAAVAGSERIVGAVEHLQSGVILDVIVAGDTVGSAELEVAEPVDMLHPRFL